MAEVGGDQDLLTNGTFKAYIASFTGPGFQSTLDFAAAASVNATVVKATPGRVFNATFFNFSAASKFVKFYNKATAPNPAADIPIFVLEVPVAGRAQVDFTIGKRFSAGIAFATTGLVAINDVTVLAVNDLVGSVDFG